MTTLTDALNRLGVESAPLAVWIGGDGFAGSGDQLTGRSPIDGSTLTTLASASVDDVPRVLHAATEAFKTWRVTPGPQRGEFVRRVGNRFRELKADLATVISWEAGKITQEALGEVQEVIDICDFAVGLSRQLHGLTIASERPSHRLAEQWHPLGPVGVITAFNFPMAVWAWNAALAWVCGNPVVWKPSEKTPLCALACQAVVASVLREMPHVPPAVSSVIIGTGAGVGETLADAPELPLISATGSTAMGRAVAQRVAARLGRSLLELGGNNGMIVAPSADLELAVRAIVFSAVGTCGQRCTSLRRLIVHESLADELVRRIASAYERLPIGNPLDAGTLVGPLIDERAWTAMHTALIRAKADGGVVHGGGRLTDTDLTNTVPAGGVYVRPALVEINPAAGIVQEETFAPILYVMRYRSLEEAISLHNNVPQGLASSILTSDMREAELFCSPAGSDCGIVNVNVGPSGAEIGGAFGGEKDTGGGRESGSDSWKAYMRRTTNTVNYSSELPLAQGIKFNF
ncbi:MAG: aldehyde dehydrogenase family protein [Candidatus Saccharimonas sp.]|nr:aldehyde dehydrogenase family protein [Planctomycetaceae bacterium]